MARRLPSLVLSSVVALSGAAPEIRRVDAEDVLRLVASHRGEVVVLSFWASWCPPCVEEFPALVAVEREFRGRGVAVVSVSADFPDRLEADLLPFLDAHRPDFPVYLKETEDPDHFARTIDPEWDGTLPATFFIGRDGRTLIKRYSRSSRYSKLSRDDMRRYLEALLED